MSDALLLGGLAGLFAGTVLAFFSHIAPYFGARTFLQEGEYPNVFGYELSRREAHLMSLLLDVGLAAGFGAAYGWFVEQGWVDGFGIVPLVGWSCVLAFVIGLIVLPLDGQGLFGRKRGVWFFVDMLITKGVWALLVASFAAVWLTL